MMGFSRPKDLLSYGEVRRSLAGTLRVSAVGCLRSVGVRGSLAGVCGSFGEGYLVIGYADLLSMRV
jgi:hypothetical protein